MRRSTILLGSLLLAALLFSFTPWYGIAYAIAVVYSTRSLTFSKTFSTVFGRAILSILMLAATIMLTGLLAWFLHLQVYPLLVLVLFALIVSILRYFRHENVSSKSILDKGDIVSICLSLVAPMIIVGSFYLPHPSNQATYQFLSTGWDNASHVIMLETASIENGYVYGKYNDVKDKTIVKSNAYPQAWHLATANLSDGFGKKVFNPKEPLLVINAYLIILLLWFIIAVYCLSRTAWKLLTSTLKSTPISWLLILLFSFANLLIQLIVFWVDISWGFANYIGILAYFSIIAAMIIENKNDYRSPHYVIALLAGSAATLSWFLPLPAIGITLLLGFAIMMKPNFKRIFRIHTSPKGTWLAVTLTFVAALATLAQVAIFVLFSSNDGSNQLNTPGGIIPVSPILFSGLCVFSFYYWIKQKPIGILQNKMMVIVGPMLFLILSIYSYQLFTTNETSYYLYKLIGIATVLIGIFFIPAFSNSIARLTEKGLTSPSIILIGIGAITLLIVGSSQPIDGFNRLFQRNSKVSYQTATELVDYLKYDNPTQEKIIVLTKWPNTGFPIRSENLNGDLVGKVIHLPYTCVDHIVNSTNGRTLKQRLKRLGACADEIDKKIIVITNKETRDRVLKLDRKNIEVVTVK